MDAVGDINRTSPKCIAYDHERCGFFSAQKRKNGSASVHNRSSSSSVQCSCQGIESKRSALKHGYRASRCAYIRKRGWPPRVMAAECRYRRTPTGLRNLRRKTLCLKRRTCRRRQALNDGAVVIDYVVLLLKSLDSRHDLLFFYLRQIISQMFMGPRLMLTPSAFIIAHSFISALALSCFPRTIPCPYPPHRYRSRRLYVKNSKCLRDEGARSNTKTRASINSTSTNSRHAEEGGHRWGWILRHAVGDRFGQDIRRHPDRRCRSIPTLDRRPPLDCPPREHPQDADPVRQSPPARSR